MISQNVQKIDSLLHMKTGAKAKGTWRERLAALPPERQAKVWAAVKETLRRLRERSRVSNRMNSNGDTLH